jgi:glyoxylase-like metal-dependent hydrolase (beta-lactamase superfamily II)
VLFSGDLFASYFFKVHVPPPILNSAPEQMDASLEKARRIGARFIVPQHYDVLDGELHRRRFDRLLARRARWRAERGRMTV